MGNKSKTSEKKKKKSFRIDHDRDGMNDFFLYFFFTIDFSPKLYDTHPSEYDGTKEDRTELCATH